MIRWTESGPSAMRLHGRVLWKFIVWESPGNGIQGAKIVDVYFGFFGEKGEPVVVDLAS